MKGSKKHLRITVILAVVLAAIMLLATNRVARADGPIYVDRDAPGPTHDGLSWATAYTTVQDGLDAATSGDELWVAEGVYTPTNTTGRDATFQLVSGVALYGGFGGYGTGETLRSQRDWAAHVTVLSGDLDGNDLTDPNGVVTDTANITGTNAYCVVTGSSTDDTAVLDGFTITGGQADEDYPRYRGGGMYNTYGSPTLSNVIFSGNRASNAYGNGSGGGMYNGNSNPTLTNVTFSDNYANVDGGGMYNVSSNPTLINVTFSGNHANVDGGGMYNGENCNPTLTNVTFSGNFANDDGGGMYNDYNSNPTLIDVTFSGNHAVYDYGGGMLNNGNSTLANVIFSGNHAYGGGGMHNAGNPTLINVTFSGNYADWSGGGMSSELGDPTLTNVTFSGNHASYNGSGMRNYSGNPMLSNCVMWGNTAPDGPQIAGSGTVNYSLVEGGYSGTGNLDADPLFADFDGTDNITGTLDDDLRLLPASPAVDAGDNTAVPTDTLDLDGDGDIAEPLPFDLDGNPRFADVGSRPDTGNGTPPIVDMGAYETAPGLMVVKTVDIGGLTNVPLGGVVTYTLVIRNSGDSVASGVVVTDPMPVGLAFGEWLNRGSAQLPPPVTWGPWDVGAGTAYTLSFTAHVTEDTGFVGQVITNTAHFTAADQAPGTSNPVTFTINSPPVADAGTDQTVPISTTVTLDGSGSIDPDGDDLAHQWMQTGGTPAVALSDSAAVSPTFTAPSSATVLTFTLTVTDTGGLTDTDTVVITVSAGPANQPPVADAGADQTVIVSTTVTLDGSGSTDPDGHTPLAYGWAQIGGTPPVLLSSSTVSRPTFTAPISPTVLTFTLTVTDALGLASTPDRVIITVTEYTIYLPLVLREN